jgi:hypothetical protein
MRPNPRYAAAATPQDSAALPAGVEGSDRKTAQILRTLKELQVGEPARTFLLYQTLY